MTPLTSCTHVSLELADMHLESGRLPSTCRPQEAPRLWNVCRGGRAAQAFSIRVCGSRTITPRPGVTMSLRPRRQVTLDCKQSPTVSVSPPVWRAALVPVQEQQRRMAGGPAPRCSLHPAGASRLPSHLPCTSCRWIQVARASLRAWTHLSADLPIS